MPRLSASLISQSRRLHPFLPLLLRQTRTLSLARSELRWIEEHVVQEYPSANPIQRLRHLKGLCQLRSLGKPLQYILRTQPFGSVEILCGKGALIPRPETEEMVTRLCESLISSKQTFPGQEPLRILDLCTGPGSIALLCASLLQDSIPIKILGVDISDRALKLAEKSLTFNIQNGVLRDGIRDSLCFLKADLLMGTMEGNCERIACHFGERPGQAIVDLIISNPPYISPTAYWKDTSRSVRLFEPKIALVPPSGSEVFSDEQDAEVADLFYPAIEQYATKLGAKGVVFETGGNDQSQRVQRMLLRQSWETSTWNDFAGIQRNVVAWRDPFFSRVLHPSIS